MDEQSTVVRIDVHYSAILNVLSIF